MDDQLTEEQLLDIIAEIDTDGSGTVDFDGELFLNVIYDVEIAREALNTNFIRIYKFYTIDSDVYKNHFLKLQ